MDDDKHRKHSSEKLFVLTYTCNQNKASAEHQKTVSNTKFSVIKGSKKDHSMLRKNHRS